MDEIKVTDKMVQVAARAFFRDGHDDKDYPHKTWEEQYREFKNLLATNGISSGFIHKIYEMNKDHDEPPVKLVRTIDKWTLMQVIKHVSEHCNVVPHQAWDAINAALPKELNNASVIGGMVCGIALMLAEEQTERHSLDDL